MKKVGNFSYDSESKTISGPAKYMRERGNAHLDDVLAGKCVVANFGMTASPDSITAVLVSMQTDYAAWLGVQRFEAMRQRCN